MRLADVQQGIANGDGLAVGIDFDHADVLVTGGRGDLKAIGRELGPAASSDRGVIGDADQTGNGRSGIIVPLVAAGRLNGVDHDGGLTGVGSRGNDLHILDHGLAAVIPDSVGLLVEHEAVVDDASFAFCYRKGFLSLTSYGFP